MPEIIGNAPLLLTLLMGNNNNNRNAAAPAPACAGTVVIHQEIVEVKYTDDLTMAFHDRNDKNVPIPGTVGSQEYTAEVNQSVTASQDNNEKNVAIPGTIGTHQQPTEVDSSLLACHDNNNKNGAIPGTVGVLEQTTEVDHVHGTRTNEVNGLGVLRLRGESQPGVLTQAQCESYKTDGYLVIPDAITSDNANGLLNEAHSVMKRVSQGGEGIIRHDISGDGENVPSPIGRILATFEPGDSSGSNPFERRIARLGCGVHKMRPFHTITHSAFHRSIVRSLGYDDARITQSQLIAKLAGIGGEIVPHQDGCVSFTNPPSALTFWYALEDTTLDNGCLCVAPGSHLTEPIRQRLIKQENGRPKFENLLTPLWAKDVEAPPVALPQEEYEYRALEVKKGTLVLFHGNLMHKSGTNMSEKNRISYNFNVIEGSGDCSDSSYLKPADGKYERL
ncbi:MAG: hypothetical protein Q9188_004186 [Gyalolechia gomerana]